MRQGLQLKFSQQLTMTPQLQQAIKLLQLSTLDLQQEIIEQLYNNPLLETDERDPENNQSQQETNIAGADDASFDNNDPENYTQAQDTALEAENTSESSWEIEAPERLAADNDWSEVSNTNSKSISNDGDFNLDSIYQVTESLQDHLYWQLNLIKFY